MPITTNSYYKLGIMNCQLIYKILFYTNDLNELISRIYEGLKDGWRE